MASRNDDIEKYLKGELTASEMHALEQKALRDPFLADAIEGADHAGSHFPLDVELLKHSIREKTNRKERGRTIHMTGWHLYMGIAAGLLILAVSSFIVLTMMRQQENKDTAYMTTAKDTFGLTKPANESAQVAAQPITKDSSVKDQKQPAQIAADPLPTGPIASTATVERVTLDEATETEDQLVVEADLTEPPVISHSEAQAREDQGTLSPTAGASRQSVIMPLERKVSGKVVSTEDGAELPGVNVLIKGTNKGTITDANGQFEIALPEGSDALVFSFIGLTSREVTVKDQSAVTVKMDSDVSQLSEMVVTGYGATRGIEETHPVIEMAEPQGGRTAFKKYLEAQLQYPNQALANQVEGKVTVQFTVQPNGQLSDFKILKGLGYGCDEEVIRLIKEGPSWAPSRKDNQPVREDVKIRLKFDLPEPERK
jgi:TonB family protein